MTLRKKGWTKAQFISCLISSVNGSAMAAYADHNYVCVTSDHAETQ